MIMDRIALVLTILGALNLGSMGIFGYDVIYRTLGSGSGTAAKVLYTIIGLAGLWCISLLFREHDVHRHHHADSD
ncbi:MAG: DUF378 domain-containing protein [Oscillospiraceae bacterium]|jgi:uncharacterized membrane protein YuzA (DUF378 family)|nr:DUF378 domain-containing protein [Oscillospiraceae bacterium]